MNLKHYTLLAILMLAIIPILILNSVLINNNRNEVLDLAKNKIEFEADSVTNSINNHANNLNNLADILSELNFDTRHTDLQKIIPLYPGIRDIIITSDNVQFYSYNNYDNTELINQMFEDETIIIKNGMSQFFNYTDSSSDVCVAIVKDIKNTNFSNGKIILIADINSLESFIGFDYNYNYTQSLVDCVGNLSNYPFVNINNYKSNVYNDDIYNYINEIISKNKIVGNSFFQKDFDGQHVIINKCKNNDLYMCTSYQNNRLISRKTDKLMSYICFVIIVLSFVLLFAVLFVDFITKPIRSMLYYIANRKEGDKFALWTSTRVKDFEELFDSFDMLITNLSNEEQKYRTIVEMSDNIIFEYKIIEDKVSFSNNFNKKFSFRPKTTKYSDSFFEVGPVYPADAGKFKDVLINGFKNTNYIYGEYRFLDIYGQYVWYLLRATLLYDNHGNKLKIIGCFFDVNNTKKSELELIERARYDLLTNLFNRETFIKRLEKEVELSSIRKNYDAVLFIDIDNFKDYNDNYNHAIGDEVLTFIGNIIKKEVKDIGFAGRYGGDEFIVCLNTQSPFEAAPKYAEKILSRFGEGFYSELAKTQFSIKCSIGISFFSRDCTDYKTVIKNADEAMYRVKKAGKSNYSIYL